MGPLTRATSRRSDAPAGARPPSPSRGRRPTLSVRARIVASIVMTAAIGLTVAGLTTFVLQRDRIVDQIDDRLLSRVEAARVIATGERSADQSAGEEPRLDGAALESTATPAAGSQSYATTREALEGVLAQLVPDRNESAVGIIDGQAAFVPGVDIAFRLEQDEAFIERVIADVGDGTVRLGTAESSVGTLRYVATPIIVGDDVESGIYVMAVDIDASLEEITDAFDTYAWVAALALVAIGLVGWFVAGRLLRPIRQLRATAEHITASERHERIDVVGTDDLAQTGAVVNGMLDRLDLALTSQRQLLDDVRHELKTPLTIVIGHLELMHSNDPREVDAARALVLDELERMAGLVDDIEALADAQAMVPDTRRTSVAEFTKDVFAKASAIPDHKWLLGETADARIDLDRRLTTQAWLQLVDNAAKYSPMWSTITIGSGIVDDHIEFWVQDEGMGIPPGSEERIFERFGRVDTGRGIRGSGLGLPIVMAIATAHGGTVSLDTSPGGSRFGIRIPRSGAPVSFDASTLSEARPAVRTSEANGPPQLQDDTLASESVGVG